MLNYIAQLVLVGMCLGNHFPHYNFTMYNLHNGTGHCGVEIRLDHAHEKLWDLSVSLSASTTAVKINEPHGCSKAPSANADSPNDKSSLPATIFGYDLIPNLGYYKMYNVSAKETWDRALETCEENGAYLVTLDTQQEVEAIKKMIVEMSKSTWGHWIGVHDKYHKGELVTVFNKTAETGTWNRINSRSGSHGKCVLFHYYDVRSDLYSLTVDQCTTARPFICKLQQETA